jgi:hypothetical protein
MRCLPSATPPNCQSSPEVAQFRKPETMPLTSRSMSTAATPKRHGMGPRVSAASLLLRPRKIASTADRSEGTERRSAVALLAPSGLMSRTPTFHPFSDVAAVQRQRPVRVMGVNSASANERPLRDRTRSFRVIGFDSGALSRSSAGKRGHRQAIGKFVGACFSAAASLLAVAASLSP